MCFFNLERYRKISGLKMRQEDLKSLMTFIYIVVQNMSRSVSQCWGLVINKRVDCILWCLYATRECVQHLWLIRLTKECTLRQIKNRKIFITLISLRLQFGAVFKDWPTSNSNWQTVKQQIVVMRTSIIFYWLKRVRVSHQRESLTDTKSVQKSIYGHSQPEQPRDSLI